MNCKDVQELLPLYVGGDLKEKRAKLVTAHVKSCEQCAGSADEYRETRRLLIQFAPPPFSEAVYTEVRQHVLREIGRESTAPSVPSVVASWFRPRIGWAVATALLFAVAVLAFYFIVERKHDQVAGNLGTGDRTETAEQPKLKPQNESLGTPLKADRNRTVGSPPATARKSRPPSVPQRVNRSGKSEALLAASSAEPILSAPTTQERALRVEIQTKDPNIRIIWFTTEKIKRDSPSERSKGI